MDTPIDVTAEPYLPDATEAVPWSDARDVLAGAGRWWLSTVRPDGRPHVAPLLAMLLDDTVCFSASPQSRKARDLAANGACVLSTSHGGMDIVVEGSARPVTDDATLRRVAEAYDARQGWPVEVRDGMIHGDGAPTAGDPPYRVFMVTPTAAFGFPTEGDLPPTRWRFRAG